MLETLYFLRIPEGGADSGTYDALADAVTAQYYATPVELRKPVLIGNECSASTHVAFILERRGKVPFKIISLRRPSDFIK